MHASIGYIALAGADKKNIRNQRNPAGGWAFTDLPQGQGEGNLVRAFPDILRRGLSTAR